jgi:hypothetical protein
VSEDKRLDRLLDYTKFHIGIYLSSVGGMVAIAAAAGNEQAKLSALRTVFAAPWALAAAGILMAIAGLAGGVIASCCTQCESFTELWYKRQGPHTLKIMPGRYWALLEHGSFWASLAFLAGSVLASQPVRAWLFW